jgi:ribonuclease Z
MQKDFELTILGTGSATPTRLRHPSAQYLRMEGDYFLIDCGEGTQNQILKFGLRFNKIKYILISHLHGDHYFGLPGMITTMSLQGRLEPLTIIGPSELWPIIELILKSGNTTLTYEINFIPTDAEQPALVLEKAQWEIRSFPLRHRIKCTGFLIKEKGPLRKISKQACEKLGVPFSFYDSLKAGANYIAPDGKTYENALLTLPAAPNRTYAYVSDSIYDEGILPHISGADWLYHEATFKHDLLDRALITFHTTSLQAGEIAARAQVKNLILGHFSARYADVGPLLEEAKTAFPNSRIAIEGELIQL